MNEINVLQVNKLYYPETGGIERIVQQISEGISDKVHVEVLVCNDKNQSKKEIIHGVYVYRTASLGMLYSMPISIMFLFKFHSMAKKKDIVHIHLPFPLADVACFLSGYKGKVVLWWHSDIVRQKKFLLVYKPFMNALLRRADTIIVATKGHIEGSKYLKKYENKCQIIPYGVMNSIDRDGMNYCISHKDQKSKCIESKVVQFLFVGRLVYYKGCDVLIKAMKNAKNAYLTIVGEGNNKQELMQLVEVLDIKDKVKFVGKVSDIEVREYLKKCDVLVLPSVARSEAFGLVQIEAMSYGKPVINTNLMSGVPYVSINKQTGITVEPNNIEELANALQYMVDHEDERARMGENARERVSSCYSEETMIESLLDLYQDICKKGTKS